MARSLNFRDFAQPALHITMNDAAETELTLTSPSVELVERLEANKDTIVATFTRGDRESVAEIWSFAADLISCNREGRQVTPEDLKGVYCMSYPMLFAFFTEYFNFVSEIENAKN
ncbi:MAG: hypothetical protein IKY65_04530 [Rikenellaceae bacterium]|nr:hypothetical protein [Rikenellaceae bacterium]